jgi:hypothetical protein
MLIISNVIQTRQLYNRTKAVIDKENLLTKTETPLAPNYCMSGVSIFAHGFSNNSSGPDRLLQPS